MADPARTQKPTPKRVRSFRERGEIALSRDLVSTAALVGGVIALFACSSVAIAALLELSRTAAAASDGREVVGLPGATLRGFLVATSPVVIAAGVAAVAAILVQLGWPPAFKGLKLELGKLSPATNLAQIWSPSAIARRSAGAIAKMIAIGAIVFLALRGGIPMHELEASQVAAFAGSIITRVLWLVVGALAVLAAIDYVLARRRLAARMQMTPDELKRELRESEGDPLVKGRRRARMRELAKRRIAVTVAKADVVVVNPTHYAVALRYDDKSDRAPIVVAKGVDELAEKIREVARKHGVPVLSRPPLARALHKHVPEGRPIPSNLYRAVAEVLAYVYRLRRGNA